MREFLVTLRDRVRECDDITLIDFLASETNSRPITHSLTPSLRVRVREFLVTLRDRVRECDDPY